MSELWRKLSALFRKRSMDRDLERELQFHLQMKAEATGDPVAARRAVGSSLAWRERARDVWGWRWLDETARDARFALRGLARNPGFAAAAVLTLALGIGASTLMFSVADATVLRPFPFPEPDRLVIVWSSNNDSPRMPSSPAAYAAVRASTELMHAGASVFTFFDIGEAPYPEKLYGERVTAGYLRDVLQVKPLVGRIFLPEDERAGRDHVMLISDRLWRSRFGASTNAIGSEMRVVANGSAGIYTIIGVLPPEVQTLSYNIRDIWLPLDPARHPIGRGLSIVGRLKPGVSREAAEAALKARIEALRQIEEDELVSAAVNPMIEYITRSEAPQMRMLGLAVAFLLLIACAGVANLMLARGAERVREMGIRLSIGAGRGRLFRQLLTESLMLSLIGGAAGAGIAYISIDAARALIPQQVLRRDLVTVDARTLTFTLAVSLIAALLFGILPAWRSARADVRSVLAGGRGGSRERARLRSALIAGEIALALMLVTGAGLMMQSFVRLAWKNLGFAREDLITLRPLLPALDPDARLQLARDIETRLSAVPGVLHVALGDTRPMGNSASYWGFTDGTNARLGAQRLVVSAAYFSTLEIPILQGRGFQDTDVRGAPPVAIVSARAAHKFWPGENPLRKVIAPMQQPGEPAPASYQIVGVAGDTVGLMLDREAEPAVYFAYAQEDADPALEIVVRTRPGIEASTLVPAVRTELAAVNRALSVQSAPTMDAVIYQQLARPRFLAVLLGTFAALALSLTTIGVGGVIGYLVRARTYEFGVRIALGATPSAILRMIQWFGGRLAFIGIALGMAGAYTLTRLVASYLYEVKPLDPATLSVAPVLLLLVVLAACYIPARRALRIDPAQSLRHD